MPFSELVEYSGLCETIKGPYVDGVGITHGSPQEHIWSFACMFLFLFFSAVKVADLNMSRPDEQCPDGLELITTPRRACSQTSTCTSIIYPTNNTQYKTVCGIVIGRGFGLTDAFLRFCSGLCATIEGPYVDGVSITHGTPREHIWSLAVQHPPGTRCPCSTSGSFTTPSFVGDDYTCETYTSTNPVWDGQGCIAVDEPCCQRPSVPMFCKELPEPTTDDIEVRLCTDEYGLSFHEYVAVEMIKLYIE